MKKTLITILFVVALLAQVGNAENWTGNETRNPNGLCCFDGMMKCPHGYCVSTFASFPENSKRCDELLDECIANETAKRENQTIEVSISDVGYISNGLTFKINSKIVNKTPEPENTTPQENKTENGSVTITSMSSTPLPDCEERPPNYKGRCITWVNGEPRITNYDPITPTHCTIEIKGSAYDVNCEVAEYYYQKTNSPDTTPFGWEQVGYVFLVGIFVTVVVTYLKTRSKP